MRQGRAKNMQVLLTLWTRKNQFARATHSPTPRAPPHGPPHVLQQSLHLSSAPQHSPTSDRDTTSVGLQAVPRCSRPARSVCEARPPMPARLLLEPARPIRLPCEGPRPARVCRLPWEPRPPMPARLLWEPLPARVVRSPREALRLLPRERGVCRRVGFLGSHT